MRKVRQSDFSRHRGRMTPRKHSCVDKTKLVNICTHRHCDSMHKFKLDKFSAWKKRNGHKDTLTNKLFETGCYWETEYQFFVCLFSIDDTWIYPPHSRTGLMLRNSCSTQKYSVSLYAFFARFFFYFVLRELEHQIG